MSGRNIEISWRISSPESSGSKCLGGIFTCRRLTLDGIHVVRRAPPKKDTHPFRPPHHHFPSNASRLMTRDTMWCIEKNWIWIFSERLPIKHQYWITFRHTSNEINSWSSRICWCGKQFFRPWRSFRWIQEAYSFLEGSVFLIPRVQHTEKAVGSFRGKHWKYPVIENQRLRETEYSTKGLLHSSLENQWKVVFKSGADWFFLLF